MPSHVVRAQQFNRERLERLFREADRLRAAFEHPMAAWNPGTVRRLLRGKLANLMFWEPSTRTRMSFCDGAHHLGMTSVWSDNAGEFSSSAKGESLSDTVRVLCEYYPDILIIRHKQEGAAEEAAAAVDAYGYRTCIINAGDGRGQHPTQALLDVYTVHRERGSVDGAHVVMGGDLANGRTVRSLAYLLAKFRDVSVTLVSPSELAMGRDITEHLSERGVPFTETTEMEEAFRSADIVYWTRIQKERIADLEALAHLTGLYRISPEELIWMRPHARILHPLPRVDEIAHEVDSDRRAAYFRQAGNGMFIRMALMCELLGSRIGR